nr:hypothetical protein Iba_chr13eCG7780 [Ipomoea batatas]
MDLVLVEVMDVVLVEVDSSGKHHHLVMYVIGARWLGILFNIVQQMVTQILTLRG